MHATPPLLFALNGSRDFAERVARYLGSALAEHEERDYEDGEHKSRPIAPVSGRQVVVFHGLYGEPGQSANDKLCRLLFFCATLKDAGARHVQVVTPYLCYGRKERRTRPQDAVISRYVATLLEASGVDRLLAMDVHNVAAFDNAFRIPADNLESTGLFASHFAALLPTEDLVVVSPDTGGIKRAEQFRLALEERLGRPIGSAYTEKFRHNDQLSGGQLVGAVAGQVAILFDDMISTGDTLLRAAAACHAAGAARLFAAATHGLFTAGAELLETPLIERVVICDSVVPLRLTPQQRAQGLDILDSSALVAAWLREAYTLEQEHGRC
ncbi:ribose-phosphate diphosphokinase [Pseudomonas panipatensis]|uniref:ribose-phosphate diphosphokinase n=1 Tax=Pseudomonas panipatensis TaxID=428992 RepID=A0A1G8LBN9_9PSED|nr:ribose-phosphate diphosphokinase [Pseudomonas panipatensis]SDI53043.1 ribose-phosphate pyrophosphokinase [Pseudomonas panipatensis]SMP75267.1 ribose-phosphate pyrophosphokinase [Pseudomonas panipatensis]